MLALYYAISLMSGIFGGIAYEQHVEHPSELVVGEYFSNLDPQIIDQLNHSKHYKLDNVHDSADPDHGPNTDGCFKYSETCKPDLFHYIYVMPIPEHPGYDYIVTFSYNYKILSIENTYLHS